jgi:hypothetical protein
MDGMTRATLWIAALVLGAYFATTFLNCALDPACELRCARSEQAWHALAAAAFIRGRRLSRLALARSECFATRTKTELRTKDTRTCELGHCNFSDMLAG